MPPAKRTRGNNDDLPSAKRAKRTNSIMSYMVQTAKQSEKEDDAVEEAPSMPASASDSERKKETVPRKQQQMKQVSVMPQFVPDKLLSIEKELCTKLRISFPSPVQYVYNPLEYAFETHAMYVRKYCTGTKKILFLGMNPGPWGMSQTGVPFGEIAMVRDWLGISGPVGHPPREHPERIVTGFQCTRSEVSGFRLWGLFRELCGNTENFFRHAYMHNYCPLAFMDSVARNITPAELKGEKQEILHKACDKSLIDIARLLNTEIIVGIGRYAEKRAQLAVKSAGLAIKVMVLRHPSPRVVGNQNWSEIAMKQLREMGVLKYFEKAGTKA